MYFDKAKIIQAALEKEKRRLIFKAWHFKVFLYNGLEKASITYKYQRSPRKAEKNFRNCMHCLSFCLLPQITRQFASQINKGVSVFLNQAIPWILPVCPILVESQGGGIKDHSVLPGAISLCNTSASCLLSIVFSHPLVEIVYNMI